MLELSNMIIIATKTKHEEWISVLFLVQGDP